jgi:hypothetical protein
MIENTAPQLTILVRTESGNKGTIREGFRYLRLLAEMRRSLRSTAGRSHTARRAKPVWWRKELPWDF